MLTTTDVSALPLFRNLDPAALRVLADHAVERRYSVGEILFRAGDDAWGIFVVLEGKVRVMRGSDGRQVIVHTEGPGGTLAEVPLFDGGPLPATAVAAEPTRCAIFARDAIRAATAASPDVAFALLARLAGRVRELVGRLDQLASQNVSVRLAAFLAARLESTGGTLVSLGMTQAQLAEELGTVREVVVRELRAVREAGIIRAAGGARIEIVDPDALRRRALLPQSTTRGR